MTVNNAFPVATLWIASTSATGGVPETLTEGLVQYGLPTILLILLGAFTFWQEKQRNKREFEAAKERKAQLALTLQSLENQMEWLRAQIENKKE